MAEVLVPVTVIYNDGTGAQETVFRLDPPAGRVPSEEAIAEVVHGVALRLLSLVSSAEAVVHNGRTIRRGDVWQGPARSIGWRALNALSPRDGAPGWTLLVLAYGLAVGIVIGATGCGWRWAVSMAAVTLIVQWINLWVTSQRH